MRTSAMSKAEGFAARSSPAADDVFATFVLASRAAEPAGATEINEAIFTGADVGLELLNGNSASPRSSSGPASLETASVSEGGVEAADSSAATAALAEVDASRATASSSCRTARRDQALAVVSWGSQLDVLSP
jgi:hypothetical protein